MSKPAFTVEVVSGHDDDMMLKDIPVFTIFEGRFPLDQVVCPYLRTKHGVVNLQIGHSVDFPDHAFILNYAPIGKLAAYKEM